MISVNENVKKANCSDKEGNDVLSLIMIAEQYGLSTGVVSTARITHATPATAYANSPSRNWENDSEVSDGDCPDIGKFKPTDPRKIAGMFNGEDFMNFTLQRKVNIHVTANLAC